MLQFISYLLQREAEAKSSGQNDATNFVASELHPGDYDVDTCITTGVHEQTFWLVMELYYYKIMPDELRNNAYMHRSPIEYNTLYQFGSRALRGSHELRQVFMRDFNNFLSAIPKDKNIGICPINIRTVDPMDKKRHAHVALLVFDATKKRLEYYDSNGGDSLYFGSSNQSKTESFYGYLVRNSAQIHRNNPQVCTIWGSHDSLQKEIASCSLWVNVIAICRMSGIDRQFLPTDFRDVREISIALRQTLLHACKFAVFTKGLITFTFQNWSVALRECKVPESQITHIRGLVEKQHLNPPKAITGDIELCQRIKDAQPQHYVADCTQITVDTYRGPINKSNVDGCNSVGSITFQGNPRSFPKDWFDKTYNIRFDPRSGLVSLNTDLDDVVDAMNKRDELLISIIGGFVDLTDNSILDMPEYENIFLNLTFQLVIIHGDLPDSYLGKLRKLLMMCSYPVLLLSPYDAPASLDFKMSPDVSKYIRYFAIFLVSTNIQYYEKIRPWLVDKEQLEYKLLNNMGLALMRAPAQKT
jgi:hypothetical protein